MKEIASIMNIVDKDKLYKILDKVRTKCSYAEVRVITRESLKVRFQKLEEDSVLVNDILGAGVRCLCKGSWGSSYTSGLQGIEQAFKRAIKIAEVTAPSKKQKVTLAPYKPVKGCFEASIKDDIHNYSIEEKVALVKELDKSIMSYDLIDSSGVLYNEYDEKKVILNTDGADISIHDQKVDLNFTAVAHRSGERITSTDSFGGTGGYEIIKKLNLTERIENTVNLAKDKLKAKHPKGGMKTLVLDPTLVGLLIHEAIGHTLEADFILSGSAAQGRIGEKVVSPLITIVDTGKKYNSASGWLAVDDEGVKSKETTLIKEGTIIGALHNRETAALMQNQPTGNARAWSFLDEPIIRMTTTFLETGDWNVQEIIDETKHGYYLKRAAGGQADSNADFMFKANLIQEIKNGELGELYRASVITGNAFKILSSVDAVGKDFKLDEGGGFCIKGQPIKVSSGGPSIRCKGLIGGHNQL